MNPSSAAAQQLRLKFLKVTVYITLHKTQYIVLQVLKKKIEHRFLSAGTFCSFVHSVEAILRANLGSDKGSNLH